ncbi:hypothetical protein Nepgr_030683 [Nepenthes gracilis]|uniref:Uncharacterized protein n=1 Tax=Nepenthes gracilis TaxID=150966 RepID=A0AAD3TFW8_NEPGR|nr:hypothetical protein Nepgr_030683 [Nepenthes gracilis]
MKTKLVKANLRERKLVEAKLDKQQHGGFLEDQSSQARQADPNGLDHNQELDLANPMGTVLDDVENGQRRVRCGVLGQNHFPRTQATVIPNKLREDILQQSSTCTMNQFEF